MTDLSKHTPPPAQPPGHKTATFTSTDLQALAADLAEAKKTYAALEAKEQQDIAASHSDPTAAGKAFGDEFKIGNIKRVIDHLESILASAK